MSTDVDPKIIKTTQNLLTKIIKKPALTEKLLKRPPFRFLHDIIINIIKTNGYMKGLYTPEEMNPDNINNKESKISFLQKAIDFTEFVTGEVIAAKPSKIVAGLEADKTNQWLQTLAKAIINKVEYKDAVEKVIAGEKLSKQKNIPQSNLNNNKKSEVNARLKPVTKSSTTNTINTKNKESISEKKEKTEIKTSVKRDISSGIKNNNDQNKLELQTNNIEENDAINNTFDSYQDNENKKEIDLNENSQDNVNENKKHDNINENHEENNSNEIIKEKDSNITIINKNISKDETFGKNSHGESPKKSSKTIQKSAKRESSHSIVRPPTSSTTAAITTKTGNIRSEMKSALPSSARPSSARPAPPKVVIKRELEEEKIAAELEEKIRLQNVKPVENLIVEKSVNENDNEDDETDFVVNDLIKANDEDLINNEQLGLVESNENQKGSLVKQLIETKKELEGSNQIQESSSNKVITKLAVRDIEKLKQSIQAMSKCVNPLGRVLDYLQEDIEVMLSELKSWNDEYKKNMTILEKEKNAIDQDLEPLKGQLKLLDRDIEEQLEKICITKANIIRNEERLQKIISTINRTL